MNIFERSQVSVIGAGRSGIGAARVLTRLGATVTLSDSQPEAKFGPERLRELHATGAKVVTGATPAQALPADTTLVVTSPGVPKTAPVLQEAVRRDIPVWSEIELAYRITRAPVVAITGTNGKTTTTLLIAAMLREAGRNAIVAGNVSADDIKKTLVEAAWETHTPDEAANAVLVAEVSSFQLEWVHEFAPHVGVLTNITPDHLNRHGSFEEYAQTKARLFAAQSGSQYAAINNDNDAAREVGRELSDVQRCWFTRHEGQDDCPLRMELRADGTLAMVRYQQAHVLLHTDDIPFTLPGAHNVENVLAAAAAAFLMNAPPEAIAKAIREFPGVAHRMEFVAEVNGICYINNSMCTNVEAARNSLRAMTVPTLVIAGGADKELDFAPLTEVLHQKAKHLILIGSAANKMETAFRAGGYTRITRADTLEAAVMQSTKIALPGEAVLLSPACASFDMFVDFEARGQAFRQAVRGLPTEMSAPQLASEAAP